MATPRTPVTGQPVMAAADLGASSGRVMVGQVTAGRGRGGSARGVRLRVAHRFPNVPVRVDGTLHWDILRLHADLVTGLATAGRDFGLASVGIDAWGVDYGLLDPAGVLLGNPVHYRDRRTDGVAARVHARIPEAELYATTGLQTLPFNTLYQLVAAAGAPQLAAAGTLLLIPDLLTYWLTGQRGAEVTIASTTQLLDVRARDWAKPLMERAGIPAAIFPPLRQPGTVIGPLLPEVAAEAGLAAPGLATPPQVVAVGSHDTASAVAAVPAAGPHFAYISSGTWSLVGMELAEPVLTGASQQANFTNEAGIDGTVRYLRNVMGLWLLQESLRTWTTAGMRPETGLRELLAEAARMPGPGAVIDPDDPAFLPPGDMPARIAGACRRTGQPVPQHPAETVRCILDSLAVAYRRAIRQVQELSGQHADVIHVVGGGARNHLLCQLTADACGLPVVAGPAEAAALGNVLVQARAMRVAPDEPGGLRALVRGSARLRRFRPEGSPARWEAAERRLSAAHS
jgi:sugar (pentulose or hexulose) kinase